MKPMTPARAKRATTVLLDSTTDRLLERVAREQGISRAEFVRSQLLRVLEQYRPHPKPRSAGIIKERLSETGDESDLFQDLER